MGLTSVLLIVNPEFMDAGIQSDCPRRRGTPSERLFPVDPDVGVIVRMNMQCERLTARNVPIAVPPGADELTWQSWVVVQEVSCCGLADVIDDRPAREVVRQPHLSTKAGLFNQPLTENKPPRGAYQRRRKVTLLPTNGS